jgi:hypothetical protein
MRSACVSRWQSGASRESSSCVPAHRREHQPKTSVPPFFRQRCQLRSEALQPGSDHSSCGSHCIPYFCSLHFTIPLLSPNSRVTLFIVPGAGSLAARAVCCRLMLSEIGRWSYSDDALGRKMHLTDHSHESWNHIVTALTIAHEIPTTMFQGATGRLPISGDLESPPRAVRYHLGLTCLQL